MTHISKDKQLQHRYLPLWVRINCNIHAKRDNLSCFAHTTFDYFDVKLHLVPWGKETFCCQYWFMAWKMMFVNNTLCLLWFVFCVLCSKGWGVLTNKLTCSNCAKCRHKPFELYYTDDTRQIPRIFDQPLAGVYIRAPGRWKLLVFPITVMTLFHIYVTERLRLATTTLGKRSHSYWLSLMSS